MSNAGAALRKTRSPQLSVSSTGSAGDKSPVWAAGQPSASHLARAGQHLEAALPDSRPEAQGRVSSQNHSRFTRQPSLRTRVASADQATQRRTWQ